MKNFFQRIVIATFTMGMLECSLKDETDLYRNISILQMLSGNQVTRCLFVMSNNSNLITGFTIGGNGTLTRTSPTTFAATGAWQASPDANGRHLYITTAAAGTILDFSIDSSCTLTNTGVSYTLSSAYKPFTSADGRYLYVVRNTAANLTTYSIQSTTGTLSTVGGNGLGTGPLAGVADPQGRFVFVASAGSDDIQPFTVNSSTGVLTGLGNTGTVVSPTGIITDSLGKYLLVAGNTSLGQFTINQSTGALTGNGTVPGGSDLQYLALDPQDRFLYATDSTAATVRQYTFNKATGQATLMGTPTIATVTAPEGIVVDPTGNFVFVGNNNANLNSYSIDQSTGQLTALPLVTVPNNPNFLVIVTPR